MRKLSKLNAIKVKRLNEAGRYADGGGLYLQVSHKGPRVSKQWLFRFMLNGRAREMGLGSVDTFTLAEARERARVARQLVTDRHDPIEVRLAERDARLKEEADNITFKEAAEKFLDVHERTWANAKHRQQWRNTLATYAYKQLGSRPIKALDAAVINAALASIWTEIPETARRVRGRVERIVQWVNDGMPLPAQTAAQNGDNQPALPYPQIAAFFADLRPRKGVGARALEFQILTASRPGAVTGARWEEVDETAKIWTVPGTRLGTKFRGRDHRVPLSDRALEILKGLPREEGNPHIFIGDKAGKPLSDLISVVKRMNTAREAAGLPRYVDPKQGNRDVVPHGFRSSFRDWAGEETSFPSDAIEMALAHTIKNKTEAAYRRGDMLERRRAIMAAWADYCNTPRASGDNVTPIRKRA